MSNSNPKSFYNQPDYNAGSSGYTTPQQIVHKPDEADLAPPPPYSPDRVGRNSDEGGSSSYGSVRNSIEQQQHGLLAPALPRNVSSKDSSPPPPKKNWNPRNSDYQQLPTSQNYDQEAAGSSSFAPRRAYQDPGCCSKWCKYIIASLLLWLVFYMYSDKLGFSSPPPYGDGHYGCNRNSVQWTDIPNSIEFSDNIELVIEGRVSNGLVTVVPLEDRHGGSISSDIQVYPASLRNEMSFDVQNNISGDVTRLVINMPQQFENEDEDCISVNIEIRLPYAANHLFINVKNIDVNVQQPFVKDVENVEIKTRNGMIQLDNWSGESLKLTTSNGDIKTGKLTSGGSIYLENTNAMIYLAQDLYAKKMISIKNSNGIIEALGSLRADDSIKVETSNAYIKLSRVFSDYVSIANANNEILVDYIEAKTEVLATCSNAPVTLSVGGTKNNKVKVTNSNAHINLHMPQEFEGSFLLSTSSGNVGIDKEDEQNIEFQENIGYRKRGYRNKGGKGDLVAQTNNADVYVAFDIQQ